MILERNRREVCSSFLQEIAASEQLFVHQISFESPKDRNQGSEQCFL